MTITVERLIQELRDVHQNIKARRDEAHILNGEIRSLSEKADEFQQSIRELDSKKLELQKILLQHAETGEDICALKLKSDRNAGVEPVLGNYTTSVSNPYLTGIGSPYTSITLNPYSSQQLSIRSIKEIA